MRKKKKNIIMVAVICVAAVISVGVFKDVWVQALFDEEDAVHVNAREIENATLIIGTHLIHISAMNDEIYEIANESASESNQMKRYYKSELANGNWFDITDAASLKDITSEGSPVANQEIEELFLTHHTKSDGITYDLRTEENLPVCIFNISNPYDLENLSKLEPLKLQYDILKDKSDKSLSDQYSENAVREFFQMDVQDDDTEKLDNQIRGLENAYRAAKDDQRAAIMQTMSAVDATRRIVVLEKISEPLSELIELLLGKDVDIEGDSQEINSDLNSGASDSMQKVEESLLTYGAKALSEGTTSLSKEEYAVKKAMISAAENGNTQALNAAAEKAALLKNIMENTTGDAKKELEYLNNTLLPAAKSAYSNLITGGVGEEYKSAAAGSNASQGVLSEALNQQLNEAEAAKSELQFLANAALSKMKPEDSKKFMDGLLSDADTMRGSIKEDAFEPYANSSVDSYTSYLNNLAANKNPSENAKALSELLKQKDDKQNEKLAALDANDLEGAKKVDAELAEINSKIDALEKTISEEGEMLGDGTTGSGTAGSGSEMTPQTALKSAEKLAKSAIATIQDGSTDGLSEMIDGLGALSGVNPDASLNALQDVYKELAKGAYLAEAKDKGRNGSTSVEFEKCMTQVEDVIAENASAMNKTSLSEDQAKAVLEEVAGKKLEEQTEEEQAALLQASLDTLEQQANEGIKKMAQILAAQMEANGSPYIFRQYNDPVNEYVPAKTISECLKYRYVFDNNQQKVTLAKKDTYYTFRAFQLDYEKGEEKSELSMNAGFQGDIYISEQDTETLFKCKAQYVPGSSLALLITEDNADQASAYLSMLLTRLGG